MYMKHRVLGHSFEPYVLGTTTLVWYPHTCKSIIFWPSFGEKPLVSDSVRGLQSFRCLFFISNQSWKPLLLSDPTRSKKGFENIWLSLFSFTDTHKKTTSHTRPYSLIPFLLVVAGDFTSPSVLSILCNVNYLLCYIWCWLTFIFSFDSRFMATTVKAKNL